MQKLFHIRNDDLVVLESLTEHFCRAMENEFWKFRMAVEFHEAGHFQDWYWKARYLLWCSALESLFTSQSPEHRGSAVAEERIKWLLGADSSVYDPGDISHFLPQPKPPVTVGSVVSDVYTARNHLAHGDRLPDRFLTNMRREGPNGPIPEYRVLIEALSFMVRKSLLRILQDGLLQHFADSKANESYFEKAGLINSAIRKKPKS